MNVVVGRKQELVAEAHHSREERHTHIDVCVLYEIVSRHFVGVAARQ